MGKLVQSKKDENKTIITCEICEWCIPTLNDEFSYCLLKLKTVNSSESCNDYKYMTGNHISI